MPIFIQLIIYEQQTLNLDEQNELHTIKNCIEPKINLSELKISSIN